MATLVRLLVVLAFVIRASVVVGQTSGSRIGQEADISLETSAGRVSLGVFDSKSGRLVRTLKRGEPVSAGPVAVRWDGRDDRGEAVAEGTYEWRSVQSPGFRARYLMSVGVNPPGGEFPDSRRSWVGDHVGGGLVAVDGGSVFIGSPATESLMSLVCCDEQMSRVEWRREQFYDGGTLRSVAAGGEKVFMLDPVGRLRRLDARSGHVEATWQVGEGENVPSDLDACGANLLAAVPSRNAVQWISSTDGKVLAEATLSSVTRVAAMSDLELGDGLAVAGNEIFLVKPNTAPRKLASFERPISAIDYDSKRREIWIVLESFQVVRLLDSGDVAQIYGEEKRRTGRFDPLRFAGIEDIAADGLGGFFIGEPAVPPRRVAHLSRDGQLLGQWFGGMAFYVSGAFDPDDPTRLYGVAPEGAVNVYRIDIAGRTWTVEASYNTGRLGDSLFPFTGPFRIVRRNGQTYLYHRLMPAVVRLDEDRGEAVPVAMAGQTLNSGRNFFQIAGTGRDGWPRPWVAGAEHHGFQDLNLAPKFFSWADSDGDGAIDPEEFQFNSKVSVPVSFGNIGDYSADGDFLLAGGINPKNAMIRVPMIGREGPDQSAPRWDFARAQEAGEILADGLGWGAPRGLSVAPDGSVNVAFQAGLLVRDHGQYEGGGWPEQSVRGSRVLGFDAQLRPLYEAGRQTKAPQEANTGCLYYPMQTEASPFGTVTVNDQTRQPPQVWTRDGLYIGSFFDRRADDGLDAGFYQVHGDDNQGIALTKIPDGRVLWLAPGIGHNRLYEVSGWGDWKTQRGTVNRPIIAGSPEPGTGLRAQYFSGEKLVYETTETPLFHEPFGSEPHKDRVTAPYRVIWEGFMTAPQTDDYSWNALLGQNEQLTVKIDGREVLTLGGEKPASLLRTAIDAGRRHAIRIEYSNPSDRAELKLFIASTTLDPTRIPTEWLHTGAGDKATADQ